MIILCFGSLYHSIFTRYKDLGIPFSLCTLSHWYLARALHYQYAKCSQFDVANNPDYSAELQGQLPLGFIEIGMGLGF